MKKNLVFRVDFSDKFGYGHLIRCLTFLENINIHNFKIYFIILSNDFDNPFLDIIKKYKIYKLKIDLKKFTPSIKKDFQLTSEILKKIDDPILIIDSYSINYNWCLKIRKFTKKQILFNDFIKKKIICDILIDQTFGRKTKEYKDYVFKNTKIFAGHKYALIRNQFNFLINYPDNNNNNNVLISMGGTDPKQKTIKVIDLIFNSFKKYKVFVIIGKNSSQYKNILIKYKNFIKFKKLTILKQKYDISHIYKKCFLCIGSGGVSAIERCKIGLPSFVYKAANNQKDIVNNLRRKKLIKTWSNNKELLELLKSCDKNRLNLKNLNINCINEKIAVDTRKMIKSIIK